MENTDLEARIIDVARSLFIEKGFAETSMSEIASKVGINRPVLHYYYRTKDKMFKAVFGMILQTVAPKLQSIMRNKDESISKRIGNVIDTYYAVFRENPNIPLFVCREMDRDADYLIETIKSLHVEDAFRDVIAGLQEEMDQGHIKKIPVEILFLSFYSMMVFPFLAKGLVTRLLLCEDETFDKLLAAWKPYLVSQMEHLLCVDK